MGTAAIAMATFLRKSVREECRHAERRSLGGDALAGLIEAYRAEQTALARAMTAELQKDLPSS